MNSNLDELPVIGKIIRQIDQDIKERGVTHGFHKLIERSGTKVNVHGLSDKTRDILTNKPVIVIANHPYESEPVVLLAALPNRKDIRMITNVTSLGIIPSLDPTLIPVYIRHHTRHKRKLPLLRMFLDHYHPSTTHSPELEHEKNIISITQASEHVSDGGLAIIFPGRRSIDGSWFTGIGHMIKQIKNKNVFIVYVYIRGTSNLDFLRLIPSAGKLLPEIDITFSAPTSISTIEGLSPKEITQTLEQSYTQWVG